MNCSECRTVLVTGGAGFIGSHLISALAERFPHWRIINIDNMLSLSLATIHPTTTKMVLPSPRRVLPSNLPITYDGPFPFNLPTTTRMVPSNTSQGVGCAPAFFFRQEMLNPYPRIASYGGGLRQRTLLHTLLAGLSINAITVTSIYSPESFWQNLRSVEGNRSYSFIPGDVCDPLFIKHLFSSENIDVVFHCAAETHVESSFLRPSRFMRVNVEGTGVLVRAALQARVQRFIYISTDEVYGHTLDDQAFDELSPQRPTNPYSASKAAAENTVMSYWTQHKFPAVITRSSNVYGPRQYHEKVIPRFLSLIQQQQKCTIQGSGRQSRHFLYVSDVTDAFLTVMEKGILGEIYNIGSSFEIPIIQLARELVKMKVENVSCEALEDWMEFVEDRPVTELRYPMSSEKLHRLGWGPQVTWEEGIRRTILWYEENPNYWPLTSEDQENSPES